MDLKQRLTAERREYFTKILNAAEPYESNDPRCSEFDHPDTDFHRMNATIAKQILEDDDKLRRELEAKEKAKENN